jgi:hypothetical protein
MAGETAPQHFEFEFHQPELTTVTEKTVKFPVSVNSSNSKTLLSVFLSNGKTYLFQLRFFDSQ